MNTTHNTAAAVVISTAVNTRAAWSPLKRPIASLVIAAQLALVLQPLSVLAQDKGTTPFNPGAQAQRKDWAP